MNDDLFISDEVIAEATSDIRFKVPGGASSGSWNDPTFIMGMEVRRAANGDPLPAGKTVVELTLKVADNGSVENVGVSDRVGFWITDASCASKEALRGDTATRINLARLKELSAILGVNLSGGIIAAFGGMNPDTFNGKAFMTRFSIGADKKTGVPRLNIARFAPIK